jgi:hypothetical protein
VRRRLGIHPLEDALAVKLRQIEDVAFHADKNVSSFHDQRLDMTAPSNKRSGRVITKLPDGKYLPVPRLPNRRDAAERFPPQIPGTLSIVDGGCLRLPKLKRPPLRERLARWWRRFRQQR